MKESQLRAIIRESIRRVLNESNLNGSIYISDLSDKIVDELLANGTISEEESQSLFRDLDQIFSSVLVTGTFDAWDDPGTYYDPPSQGCEIDDIDTSDVMNAIDKLQWPENIKQFVIDKVTEWEESQNGGDYDEKWRINEPDDRDEDLRDYYVERDRLYESKKSKMKLLENKIARIVRKNLSQCNIF